MYTYRSNSHNTKEWGSRRKGPGDTQSRSRCVNQLDIWRNKRQLKLGRVNCRRNYKMFKEEDNMHKKLKIKWMILDDTGEGTKYWTKKSRGQNKETDGTQKIVSLNISHFLISANHSHIQSY